MTTSIKAKLKKSDDQTNIVKYRIAVNITEYHIKINILKNHHSKIHEKDNYFLYKIQVNVKNQLFGHNYRVTFYQTVSGIFIPSLKSIGQLKHAYVNKNYQT